VLVITQVELQSPAGEPSERSRVALTFLHLFDSSKCVSRCTARVGVSRRGLPTGKLNGSLNYFSECVEPFQALVSAVPIDEG
jgi:hypothetical protein